MPTPALLILQEGIRRRRMVDRQPPRTGDQLHTRADIRRAQRVLGYQPTTPLAEGLARQVEWQRALLDR